MNTNNSKPSEKKLDGIIIVVLIIVSLATLASNLGSSYLWQDEAQTALIARTVLSHGIPLGDDGRNSFSQEWGFDAGKDRVWKWHTWLPFYLTAASFALLGQSAVSARLPFVLFGVATVVLVYIFSRSLWNSRRTGIFSAVMLLATIPFDILCRQCRYYAPTMFFSLLVLYFYYQVLNGKKLSTVWLVVTAVLLFHTQQISFLAPLGAVFGHAVLFRRDKLKPVFLSCVIAVAITAPWMWWIADLTSAYSRANRLDFLDYRGAFFLAASFTSQIFDYVLPPMLIAVPLLAYAATVWRKKAFVIPDRIVTRGVSLLGLFVVAGILAVALPQPPGDFFRYVAPVIPACAMLIGLAIETGTRLHPVVGVLALVFFGSTQPLGSYAYELTHNYKGPLEGIVRYLNKHAKPGDIVAITYEDLPIKFYTNLRVVGGLTGEDLTPAKTADWVILRSHLICNKDSLVSDYILNNVPLKEAYRMIELPYPDTAFQNRESPQEHMFKTATDEQKVVIYQKMK